MKSERCPDAWGLRAGPEGELMIGNHGVVGLAEKFGTPLHVVNESRLIRTAATFNASMAAAYPGKTSVHYAMKCNSVPAIAEAVHTAGLNVEVMTEFELELALRLGWNPGQIIVNGPCKTRAFLRKCVEGGVRLVIVDSIEELDDLNSEARDFGKASSILLRVNPDFVPRQMNRGTATGSRSGCAFGLDLKGGEVDRALDLLPRYPHVSFRGYHIHIGTGAHDPEVFAGAIRSLKPLIRSSLERGREVKVLDVGGGFASMTTRELTTSELLLYQGFDRFPDIGKSRSASFDDYATFVTSAVLDIFPAGELPELIFEPGRCIVSSNQFLLLTVHRVKTRDRLPKWLVTDGGLSTVTMPTYYEYHEVLLGNDVNRPRTERASIIGPACFAGDIVYRNKHMPRVYPGEIIAVMDSGAYFTALESSFGFARPAIIAVNGAQCRLIRTRETFEEMIGRDQID